MNESDDRGHTPLQDVYRLGRGSEETVSCLIRLGARFQGEHSVDTLSRALAQLRLGDEDPEIDLIDD